MIGVCCLIVILFQPFRHRPPSDRPQKIHAANLASQRKHAVLSLSKPMLSKTPEKKTHPFDAKKSPIPTWNDWFTFDFLGVLCIFFIYAGSSVPAINEPHYWTKAAHFWNPGFGLSLIHI